MSKRLGLAGSHENFPTRKFSLKTQTGTTSARPNGRLSLKLIIKLLDSLKVFSDKLSHRDVAGHFHIQKTCLKVT